VSAKVKAKVKPAAKPAAAATPAPAPELPVEDWRTPPATTEDCLARIRALGLLVEGHIDFMCAVGNLPSSSAEANQRAAIAFYERLRILERVLGGIREELWLG
jgi:hypothetical protein